MRLENKSFRPKSRLECGLTKQSMLTADEHGTNDMITNIINTLLPTFYVLRCNM